MRATSEQKEFNDFLQWIKERQKNIDMNLFKKEFDYETPEKMLEYLHSLETTDDYNQATSLIEESFTDFKNMVEDMSESDEKNMGIKIFKIVDKILEFASKERKQKEEGLKILTPNEMLRRLPISLAQLKAGNNSEKLKNEIRQLNPLH